MAAPEAPIMSAVLDRAPSPHPKPSSSAPAVLSPALQMQTPTQHHASAFSTPATIDAFSTPVQINGATSTIIPAGQAKATGDSLPNLGDMEAKCGGCQLVIDQDGGGVVVAFGSSLWHVDCFRCAKCKERVSADTNLLLLGDGNPVCGNCSYQCYVCKQPITEEAIMTGDESYHAHCFTCRTCKRRIEELVFAKTSQGIYCMSCHNERVARSRRHAEAKRQRAARKEKEKDATSRDESTRRGDRDVGPKGETSPVHSSSSYLASPNLPPPPSHQSPGTSPQITPSVSSTEFPATLVSQANASSQNHVNGFPQLSEAVESEGRARAFSADQFTARAASPSSIRQPTENAPLSASPGDGHVRARTEGSIERNPQPRQPSSSRPGASSSSLNLSQHPSFSSTGPRPDTIGLGVGPIGTATTNGLGVPTTSKADRRRSINPAMSFNMDAANSTFAIEPRMSPLPPSPLRASFTDLQNEPPRSPSSPTPSQINGTAFPFNRPTSSASTAVKANKTQGSRPRSSSSSDQAITDFPRPEPTGQAPTSSRESSSDDEVPAVPPKNETNETEVLVADLTESPRTSMPPNLPPMSFSSSDSDFALILNGIDQSPNKTPMPQPSVSLPNGHHDPVSAVAGSSTSPPESPAKESAPSISRSPQMDHLAAGGPMGAEASGSRSRSPSRSRLSPNDSMSPRYLRTRQTSAESNISISSRLGPDSAFSSLAELIATAKHNQQESVTVDLSLLSSMLSEAEDLKDLLASLNRKYTGAKRTSQQYSEGLTVAGEEYDKEVSIRRDLEAEVYKLRAQVHAQTARLSVMSGDERRQENMRRRSNDLANSLTGLERDISRLRAQRDMTLAEVEELHAKRDSLEPTEETAATLGQSLTHRLDTIKEQYREELEPLTAQREALQREIAELRESREQFLEESTALAAKNDELAELNAQLTRQSEAMQEQISRQRPTIFSKSSRTGLGHPAASPSMSSLNTAASTLQEVPEETARVVKVSKPEPVESVPARRFKWYKSSKGPDASTASASISRPILLKNGSGGSQRPSTEFGLRDHQFSQHSTMRFTKCEVCGEKMWGLQEVKCSLCGIVCHSKCGEKLPRSCPGVRSLPPEINDGPAAPSLFGRELTEQVDNDKLPVPVIVTKCIEAVEAVGMEYEGIYRKTGGSSQSKQITQLFERGDYDSFDLADIEAFNDISSVTSVLKTYFRSLPNPLLTHQLHESFVAAATIRDAHNKHAALCALLKELPKEHYATLKVLMLHLNRVTSHSAVNRMTSQNLGVVFGPTLMRSTDPTREFDDMGGKALSVQWMVDNAPQVFAEA